MSWLNNLIELKKGEKSLVDGIGEGWFNLLEFFGELGFRVEF
jgi:hypothetical protein